MRRGNLDAFYRGQRIIRRNASDRRSTIDAFNEGGLDVLIYNSAGATGGSYHASPEFADQRPRTLIEMETPVDIIKYIQSQGRGNRYGQVAKPRIASVMTGLIPEMRILQQRNRKLRALGASVDGNRSHPLLMDDIPDLLNKVGDQATTQILRSNPELTRRLGFTEFMAGNEGDDEQYGVWNTADSGASGSLVDSIANKALTRSIVLSAPDQERLVNLITIEFEAIIEELESRNSNPLRPRELPGQIEIHATSLFSGVETSADDMETSAFFAPLYISTGTHHMNDETDYRRSASADGRTVQDCRRHRRIRAAGSQAGSDAVDHSGPSGPGRHDNVPGSDDSQPTPQAQDPA